MNTIVREMAAERSAAGVRLLDASELFADEGLGEDGIPGDKLFYDHVHLRFAGDYWLARNLYPLVTAALQDKLGVLASTNAGNMTEEECAARLAYTDWDAVYANGPILAMTLGPAFAGQLEHARRRQAAELALRESIAKLGAEDIRRSVDVYRAAVALAPNDWRLRHNFGWLLFNVGQYSAAADQLAAAARLMPHAREVRLLMGEALAKAGRRNEAIRPQYR